MKVLNRGSGKTIALCGRPGPLMLDLDSRSISEIKIQIHTPMCYSS
jgi:hypothetical protein